jgi:hypothetical protein
MQRNDVEAMATDIAAQRPDVIVLAGWAHPPFRKLTTHP